MFLGTGGDFRKTIKQTSNKTSHHLKMYKKNRRIIIDVGHLKVSIIFFFFFIFLKKKRNKYIYIYK